MKNQFAAALTAALLVVTVPADPAVASSCNHEIVVPIKVRPGQTDWQHYGKGTHFVGYFLKGQQLTIGAAGGKHDTGGDLSWTSSRNDSWHIRIDGPNGFSKFTIDGYLGTGPLPTTGKYIVSIGPCAVWGAAGTIAVHASDPRLTIE